MILLFFAPLLRLIRSNNLFLFRFCRFKLLCIFRTIAFFSILFRRVLFNFFSVILVVNFFRFFLFSLLFVVYYFWIVILFLKILSLELMRFNGSHISASILLLLVLQPLIYFNLNLFSTNWRLLIAAWILTFREVKIRIRHLVAWWPFFSFITWIFVCVLFISLCHEIVN